MGIGYVIDSPALLTRFIGAMELLGVLGIMVPMLTGVMRYLTPLAALGLSLIQVLVIALHAWRGELAESLPSNLVLLSLSVFVLWGRRAEFSARVARDTVSTSITQSGVGVDRLDCSNIS